MKFSVIICTYNYAHFLPDALRAVAAQTFSDFELLIVDDGSTDNTEEVVRQFFGQFRHCVYLKKPHTGLADSRNFGIRRASGTHIAFLDADDLWSPEYLQTMKSLFETHPLAELVSADVLIVQTSGTIVGPLYPPGLPALCGPITSSRDLFSFFHYSTPSALVLRKSLYERIGPLEVCFPVSGEDWDWVLRAILSGAFCIRHRQKLVLYRLHGSNLTTQADKIFEAWLWIYKKRLRGQPVDREIKVDVRKQIYRWLPSLLANYPAAKNRQLIAEAIEAVGQDRWLSAARFLTYFGLSRAAKFARGMKRFHRRIVKRSQKIDLAAAPELMFAAVSKFRQDTERSKWHPLNWLLHPPRE